MDIALSIVVTVLLTICNGYFSMSEMALSTAKKVLLDHEADEGNQRAALAARMSENPDEFLAAIQVAITLVGFASSAFAATNLSTPLAGWMESLGMHADLAAMLAPVLITLLVSYFSIVVGELVPKRMAMADAEGVAKRVAGPLRTFSKIVRPLVFLTAAGSNGLSKILHIKSTDDRNNVSEDEIKYMVTDADDLSDEEKSMIHEVIDMGDTIAREVMVPRVDMTAMEDTSTCGEVLDVMRRTGYSRIPIYHEDVDRISGIAHIKDLISAILDEGAADQPIVRYMRDPDFVPDTKDIIPLMQEMQNSHDQMIIVVDEYGGTAGIITIEDIVEEIVGEIEDEFDPDNKYLTQLSDREWLVDGRFPIDDAIDLGWPIQDNEEYETIAGFVLELADSVPHPGDVFQKDGYLFRVQSMRGRRVAMLRVTAPEPPKPEPAEPADDQDQKDKDAKKDSKGLKLRKDKKDKDQSKGDDESKDEERQEQAQERMAEAREETSDGLTPDVD
ncbi:MAG: hemolysin family protein [Atopobiaceae bacterium]